MTMGNVRQRSLLASFAAVLSILLATPSQAQKLEPVSVRMDWVFSGYHAPFFVGGGILEVQPHLVSILADSALRSEHADEESAAKAKKDAESKLAGAKTEMDLKKAQQELIEAGKHVIFPLVEDRLA